MQLCTFDARWLLQEHKVQFLSEKERCRNIFISNCPITPPKRRKIPRQPSYYISQWSREGRFKIPSLEGLYAQQSPRSLIQDFIPREAGTGIAGQKRVNERGGERGTGSRLWPRTRWSPEGHFQACAQVWCFTNPRNQFPIRVYLPRQQYTAIFLNMPQLWAILADRWWTSKIRSQLSTDGWSWEISTFPLKGKKTQKSLSIAREMIKSADMEQSDYVNSSSLHFCHASQDLDWTLCSLQFLI